MAIGHHGLTPAVLHEADVALTAHELVKVRVATDDRAERESLLARICDALDCAPVQQIGKLLVLWRPRPVEAETKRKAPPSRTRSSTTSSAQKRGTAEPAPRSARDRPAARKAPTGVPRAAMPRRRRGIG